jgi:hypothetical protein
MYNYHYYPARCGINRYYIPSLIAAATRAIDIHNHIDKKELRESYLAHMPQLGI